MTLLSGTIAYSGKQVRRPFVDAMLRECPTLRYVRDPQLGNPGSSWRCERLAWLDYEQWEGSPSHWMTHHLVLEDDVILCEGFGLAATTALLQAGDDVIVSFYSALREVDVALSRGEHWARYKGAFYNCQAVAMPVGMIKEFVAFGDQPDLAYDEAADWRIRLFAREKDIPIYMTCPSLVDHGLPSDSLIKGHGNKTRIARSFAAYDAHLIDWSKGAPCPTH